MARETKIGLIVGLGVILFVSVFVSDYISQPTDDADWADRGVADFNRQTSNQTPVRPRPELVSPLPPVDTSQLAAVSLERAERGQQRTALERGAPPIRQGNPTPPPRVDNTTPAASNPYTNRRNPVGYTGVREAAGPESESNVVRIGPDPDVLDELLRVDIPLVAPRPRQTLHTVKPGENLSEIARQHYDGDGNMWRSIRDANPGKVGPNGEIAQGVSLVIPKRTATADPALTELLSTPGSDGRPARQRVRLITVQPGDSLSELAAEHLGSAGQWQRIMAVNDDVLDSPRSLRSGMKLRIPVEQPAPAEPVADQRTPQLDPASTIDRTPTRSDPTANTYTVRSGDNLYRIAAKTLGDGERFNEIYLANRDKLSSPNDIQPGMKLILPDR